MSMLKDTHILPPEFVAADYKLSVFSTIELNGEHYMIKYNIPSSIAFISFVETKIRINEMVDKILQLID
ncbi:MAG: hypothetical protein RMI01_09850 [Thermodesulfovibrio sp.]|nr:hypothetical protein [Thermodesulfovibrio sp.]